MALKKGPPMDAAQMGGIFLAVVGFLVAFLIGNAWQIGLGMFVVGVALYFAESWRRTKLRQY